MSLQELETAVAQLSPEQLQEFSAWFEAYLAEVCGDDSKKKDLSAARESVSFDQIKHLLGVIEGPGDLSTNPKYMEGFGESSLR